MCRSPKTYFLIWLAAVCCGFAYSDTIVLKNGNFLKCKIVKEESDQVVVVPQPKVFGKMYLRRENILEIKSSNAFWTKRKDSPKKIPSPNLLFPPPKVNFSRLDKEFQKKITPRNREGMVAVKSPRPEVSELSPQTPLQSLNFSWERKVFGRQSFSLDLPSHWKIQSLNSRVWGIRSPREKVRISLLATPAPPISLKKLTEVAVVEHGKKYPQYQKLGESEVQPGRVIEIWGQCQSTLIIQRFILSAGKIYVISAFIRDSGWEETARDILRSWREIPPVK